MDVDDLPLGTDLFPHQGVTLANTAASEVEGRNRPAIKLVHQEILKSQGRRPGNR